tara:strand:+ start:2926 stop:4698 length:1773 start_codon:yes stop_codon:yes gene_type:complete
MATKIGFKAKPLIDSGGVDWVSVTKDVVNTLTEQEEAREATRVKGQADYAADVKKMVETPLGKDAEANEWLTNGITSITGSAGMDNRLWRSGALSTKDYMRNRANRTQGTDLVLSAYKTYNKNYDAVMEGIDDGSLAKDKMLFLKAQAESMFDFGKTGLYINPLNSEINVAKKELVDGAYVMSDNPNEFLNASELMQAASAMYKGFDANKAAATLAEGVAKTILRTVGGTDIIEAYRAVEGLGSDEQKKLNEARLLQVKAILNDEAAGAYLTDTLQEGFSFTKDADEAATKNGVMSKMILLNQDGSTSLSKKQMEYAVDKFDDLLEVYLPKTRKEKIVKESDKKTITEGQKLGQTVTALAEVQSANTVEGRKIAAANVAGNSDIIKIVETPEEILITRQASTKDAQPVTTSYPRGESTFDWVKGSASGITGIKDLDTALKNSSLTEGMVAFPITNTTTLFERTTPPKKKGGLTKFNEQIDSDFSNIEIEGEKLITDDDFEDDAIVIGKLTPLATKYGIRLVNPTNYGGSQSIQFLVGSGTNLIDQVIEFNDTDPDGLLKSLKGFIKSSKDAEARYLALDSEKTGMDYSEK